MAGTEADQAQPDQVADPGRRRAAGIYGAIVTAAIIAAAGGEVPTLSLAVAVLVTLLVYWIAEEYAEILAEHVTGGRLPSREYIRGVLANSWPMVSASYLPLIVLIAARLAGASPNVAANVGLVMTIVLLTYHGWSAARASELHRWRLVGATLTATALGLVMVLLKDLVLLHLH
jgi:hypothetical protein